MECEQYDLNGLTVVKILSDKVIQSNADEFKALMTNMIRGQSMRLVLDLSEVEFIDSRGLGVFISILKSLGPAGEMALCSVNDNVYKVFELTRLDKLFTRHADIDAAISGMQNA